MPINFWITQKVKKIWLKNSFKNLLVPMLMLLFQEDPFLILFFISWTSIKLWLSELWANLNSEELQEPSEQQFFQNLTHQHLKKSASQMMSELNKLLPKKLLSSKDQLKIVNFQQLFWEEAQETFYKILKEPLMMESTFTNQWSENQFLFQVLEALKSFYLINFKPKPRNWLDLINTVTTDLPRLLKFSQES